MEWTGAFRCSRGVTDIDTSWTLGVLKGVLACVFHDTSGLHALVHAWIWQFIRTGTRACGAHGTEGADVTHIRFIVFIAGEGFVVDAVAVVMHAYVGDLCSEVSKGLLVESWAGTIGEIRVEAAGYIHTLEAQINASCGAHEDLKLGCCVGWVGTSVRGGP